MKLTKVSGLKLIKFLEKLGYSIVRRRGSHIRLEKETKLGKHKITVPFHKEIAIGTLNSILKNVSLYNNVPKEKLIELLNEL